MSDQILLYDTTLRDGTQREGISCPLTDKLKIAQQLDEFGVDYIEGGWPGSNPKDAEFFARMREDLELQHARSPPSARPAAATRCDHDANMRALLEAQHARRHARRQELGSARHRGARDHARRESAR